MMNISGVFPTMPMIRDLEMSARMAENEIRTLQEQHDIQATLSRSRNDNTLRELRRIRAMLTATCIFALLTFVVAFVALGYAL